MGCGIAYGCDHGQTDCGGLMQAVEHVKCGATSCVKCGATRDVVVRCINDVANISRDLKCGVEYMVGMWRYV